MQAAVATRQQSGLKRNKRGRPPIKPIPAATPPPAKRNCLRKTTAPMPDCEVNIFFLYYLFNSDDNIYSNFQDWCGIFVIRFEKLNFHLLFITEFWRNCAERPEMPLCSVHQEPVPRERSGSFNLEADDGACGAVPPIPLWRLSGSIWLVSNFWLLVFLFALLF